MRDRSKDITIHGWNIYKIFLQSEPSKSSQQNKIWCLEQSYSYPHNSWWCDVTSRLFVLVKCLAVKKTKSDFKLGQQARVFNQVGQTKQDIIMAGERSLI